MPLPFDVTADTLLSASQLAKHTGVVGGACRGFRFKIYRWMKQGVIVQQTKVKLRGVRDGGRWYVRWGDYLEFRGRCTRAAGVEDVRMPTPAEIQRRSAKAKVEWLALADEALGRQKTKRAG